jgi:hypothetical protein
MTRNVLVRTDYWPKPIPLRSGDWTATLDGYEPGDPIGHGESEAEAVFDLYNQIFEREEDDEERYRHDTGEENADSTRNAPPRYQAVVPDDETPF